MYKLLPEQLREKVAKEYSLRRLNLMLEAGAVVFVIAIGGLFPSYILSRFNLAEASEKMKWSQAFHREKGGESAGQWLSDINLALNTLSPELDKERPSELLLEVIGEKPSGIKLTSFKWSKDGGRLSLNISGVASSRQALLALQDALKKIPSFSSVPLPVSSLAKDKDISFQLKLTPEPLP